MNALDFLKKLNELRSGTFDVKVGSAIGTALNALKKASSDLEALRKSSDSKQFAPGVLQQIHNKIDDTISSIEKISKSNQIQILK